MQMTPIPESSHVVETLALRGLAVMLAPVVFVTVFTVALASLPAAAVRSVLGRA